MGNRNLVILVIALVLGVAAVIFANSYFTGVEERQAQIAEEQQLTRIVVASQPFEFGTPLTPDNTRLQNFPANSVPEGAFTSSEQALAGGRVALRPMVPGEPILRDKVSGSDGRAVLSSLLPEGMRAVSIPVSAASGVSGFVRPNDIVDVILIRQIPGEGAGPNDMMADVILESVPVLAIDQVASEDATDPAVGSTAVLQVDQFDAQRLVLALRVGQLSLALRNVESQEAGTLTTVTQRDLGNPGFYIAAARQAARRAAPQRTAATAPAPAVARSSQTSGFGAAISRPSGPTMSVYRGVEATEYPVSRLGGR